MVRTVDRVPGRIDQPNSIAALILASLGFFLVTLDVSIVNLALPSIRQDLGGGTSVQQWILDGYTLFFAALLLCFGNLSDRIGAKRAFVLGIFLFGLASLLCTIAPTAMGLIIARCAQGATAALMLPASMTLINEAFPDSQSRAKALGVWAAGGAVASAAGPVLGGALSIWDWRLVFAVNLPICVAMLALSVRVQRSPRRPSPFDWSGQILVLVGLSSILFALIEGGEVGYGHPAIVILFVLGVVAQVLFVLVQAHSRHPMMPLVLFRNRPTQVALFAGFTFIYAWFGSVFVASLYLQQELGIESAIAGLVFLPGAVLSFFGNLASGPLSNKYGPRLPVVLGMASIVIGLVALGIAASTGSAVFVGIAVVLVGAGGSVAMPSVAGVVLENAPDGQAGVASAVSNTFRQIGGALAVAVLGVLVVHGGSFVTGMQIGLASGAVLAIICLVAAVSLLPGSWPRR